MKIVIVIQKPQKEQTTATKQWQTIVRSLKTPLAPLEAASIQTLGESSWLILSDSGLSFLSRALSAAEQERLPYQLLFVEDSSVWSQGCRKHKNLPPIPPGSNNPGGS
jgi:hypothetical protein